MLTLLPSTRSRFVNLTDLETLQAGESVPFSYSHGTVPTSLGTNILVRVAARSRVSFGTEGSNSRGKYGIRKKSYNMDNPPF